MAESVVPLLRLAVGGEQQVHRNAMAGELVPELSEGLKPVVIGVPVVAGQDHEGPIGLGLTSQRPWEL